MSLRLPVLVSGMGILLLTVGCRSLGGCSNPESYAGAEELPRLKIPVGLDGLDTTQALQIPERSQPVVPRDSSDACLEEPPAMREPGSNTVPIGEESGRGVDPEPERRPTRPISPPR